MNCTQQTSKKKKKKGERELARVTGSLNQMQQERKRVAVRTIVRRESGYSNKMVFSK
jgi:hypothetical protein